MKITAKNIIIIVAGFCLLSILYLYIEFANDAGDFQADNNKADAIVVLTGGLGRVDTGLELFLGGMADYLILAGVDKDATIESIFLKKELVVNKENILLEKNSTSTYENAVEIKKIIKAKGIKSVILITSFYHMKRAAYTFSMMLPAETKLSLYPISTANFDEKTWWRGSGPAIMIKEFIKYYWYKLRI